MARSSVDSLSVNSICAFVRLTFGHGQIVPEHENDGLHLLQHIQKQGIQSIAQVEGPFALIYIEVSSNLLIPYTLDECGAAQNDTISFCRDPQGRRSLLVHYVSRRIGKLLQLNEI